MLFRSLYDEATQKKFSIGSTVENAKNVKLYFKLPSEPTSYYEVVLIKNGARADTLNTFEGLFALSGPGTYRLQVRISPRLPLPDAIMWLCWIYTINFYVH